MDHNRAFSAARPGESDDPYRNAFERAPIGITITALDGRLLQVNRAFCDFLGYPEEDLVGRPFPTVSHPDDAKIGLALQNRALAGEGDVFQLEKRYIHRLGHPVWATVTVSLIRDADGTPLYTIAQVEDIGERRRSQEALARRDAILGAVAASAELLLQTSDWEEAIGEVLRRLGEAADVHSAYLLEVVALADGSSGLRQCFDWRAPGLSPRKSESLLLGAPVDAPGYERWHADLAAGRIMQAPVREFPAPARDELAGEGIVSLLAVPVFLDGTWWGHLGFDDCETERVWTAAETDALRAAAGTLGAAIQRKRASAALHAADLRYRSVVETVPVITYVDNLDETGSAVYVSPQIETVLGYSPEQWLADPRFFLSILHPDDGWVMEGDWPEGHGPHRSEYRVIAADGRVVWILDEFVAVHDEEGHPLYAQGYMLDVTERRRMEEALREANEMLARLVQASPVAIVLYDLDQKVQLWNPAAEQVFGWRADEVLGRVLAAVPPGLEREHAELWEAAAHGEQAQAFETQRLRQDGSLVDVSMSGAPLRDADGRTVAIVATYADVGERRRALEALQESEQRFHAVFRNALDALAILDDEGRFLEVNDALADLLGASREEIGGRLAGELAPAEQAGALAERLGTLLERGELSGEWDLASLDGHRRQVEFAAKARFLPGRHLVMLRDVTERRLLEAQLAHSQRMEAIGRLAGGVAHDFNNLLTAIGGYADLLLAGLTPVSPLRRDAEEIARAAERAAALVDQLLAFSRRQALQPRVVDLNTIVGELELMLRRLIGEDIELVADLDPGLGHVSADPTRLEQMIVNLAVNARDAMPQGGTLTLETRHVRLDAPRARRLGLEAGRYARLRVTDTGTGMDEVTRSRAFEPFFTTKGPGKGTGLGLATVFGIVTQSGGAIGVESEPGHGTTFSVHLPRVAPEAATGRRRAEPASAGGGSETILLVEDEEAVRGLARRVLASAGYAVLAAAGGDEAIQVAERHGGPIHLLLTDVVMPGMSGRELADRLCALRPDLDVLYMSGYADDSVFERGVTDGGAGFIPKPFTPDTLRQKVREALRDSPAD